MSDDRPTTRVDRVSKHMSAQERRALLFTLATTRRHLERRQAKLRRLLRDTATELGCVERQLDDIYRSENFLREW